MKHSHPSVSTLFTYLILTLVSTACRPGPVSPENHAPKMSSHPPVSSSIEHANHTDSDLSNELARDLSDPHRLSQQAFFTRASLDLRGIRPTIAELKFLENNPHNLDDLLFDLVDDPRFLDRIQVIFAPAFRTLIDFYVLEVYCCWNCC